MPQPYSEADTRQQLIDERLRLAGWDLADPSQVIQELDIYVGGASAAAVRERGPQYAGHRFADYALLLRGKPAAVVEAKKTSRDAQVGQEQAKQYAEQIARLQGGPLPFIMYTNGYDTFFWDSDRYPPDRVMGFPSRDDLEWLVQRRETQGALSVELVNTGVAGPLGYDEESTAPYFATYDAYFGTDRWQAIWRARSTDAQSAEMQRRLLELYRSQLRTLWTHAEVVATPMKAGHKLYKMIFAYDHPAAGSIAKAAAGKAEQRELFS